MPERKKRDESISAAAYRYRYVNGHRREITRRRKLKNPRKENGFFQPVAAEETMNGKLKRGVPRN